MIRLKGNNKLN